MNVAELTAEARRLSALLDKGVDAQMFATMSAPAVRKHPGAMATPNERGDMPERTDISEADPCVVCGTTGGHVPSGRTSPSRKRGACESCYKRFQRHGRLDELDRVRLDAPAFLDRLLEGDIQPDEGGCILWPGNLTNSGYGVVRYGASRVPVTRLVLEAFVGPPPSPDHEAAHAPHEVCGNRNCVNADHLRWATHEENVADMVTDGTAVQGEQVGTSKLTSQQAREVRSLYEARHITQREIAARYGVSRSLVSMIGRGKAWQHLDDEGRHEPS